MKIAIPVAQGRLCMHFGHCDEFAVVDVDVETKQVQGTTSLTPPPHQPGVLPPWLKEQGVDLVIAGGMGGRAKELFAAAGVEVITGAPAEPPTSLVEAYLASTLQTGPNACDH